MSNGEQSNRGEWVRSALDEYGGPLTRYAARLTGDADRARDIVQDTFVRLCAQDPAQLDGRLPEWLFTVCRNGALAARRKNRRMKPLTDAHTESTPNADASPDVVAEGQESIRRMLRMLSELPDNQQEVVRLKYHHDMSYRQISEITNLTVSNVGYLIHTAIATLRRRFETPTPLAVQAGRSQS